MRLLLLIFLLIPVIEIGVFVWVGGYIGPWPVMGLIVLTALLGVVLTRQQGMETWRRAQESISHGNMPTEQLIDGLCILIGSVFLVTPGFVTDLIGIILILPFTRYPLKLQIIKFFKNRINRQTITFKKW